VNTKSCTRADSSTLRINQLKNRLQKAVLYLAERGRPLSHFLQVHALATRGQSRDVARKKLAPEAKDALISKKELADIIVFSLPETGSSPSFAKARSGNSPSCSYRPLAVNQPP